MVRIIVIVTELDVVTRQVNLAVFLDDPLIDRMLRRTRMDVVLLHLQAGVLRRDIRSLVVVHVGEKLHVVERRSLKEPPAIRALLNGGQAAKRRIVVVARRALERLRLLNHHVELAGIPSVVAVGRDLEADLVVALDLDLVKAEAQHVVVAITALDLDLLGKKLLAVVPDGKRDAVGIVSIFIVLAELDIGACDVDVAVLGDDPLVNRVELVAGVDVILLHLEALSLGGDITGLVTVHLRQQLGIIGLRSLEEPPAVRALLHGSETRQRRVVVLARLHRDLLDRLNHDGELAAVPSPVAVGADLEAQLVATLDGE